MLSNKVIPVDVQSNLSFLTFSLQGFVLLWKKNGNILSVGDTVLGNVRHWKKQMSINYFNFLQAAAHYYLQARENGNNLVISQVEPEDEGELSNF